MIVLFNTTYLAPGQYQAADKVRLNGEQIVDEADFFRAATKAYFPRGNVGIEFSFVTHWSFPTLVAAEVFALTHIGQLPMTNTDSDLLQCTCGEVTPATQQVVYGANAVLKSARILEYKGTSVDVEYTLLVPAFSSSVPPGGVPAYPNPNELVQVFRRGKIAIPNGATTVVVAYSSALPGLPGADPYCWVSGPTGSPIFGSETLTDTVTTSGFTAQLSTPAPSGAYFLNYAVFM